MHLRFEGQEQIEETLVANEDKHGGREGREGKVVATATSKWILSVLSRGSNSSKLCKQVSYLETLGFREQILSLLYVVQARLVNS